MAVATLRKPRRAASPRRNGHESLFVTSNHAQDELRARTRKLLDHEIDFISNADFGQPDARRRILGRGTAGEPLAPHSAGSMPKDLPAHLARLCESKLLTADEERQLFRRMNYLKYRANVLRTRLNPASPDVKSMDEIDRLIAQASAVRDQIIKANMRLVIAIVKKFVTPKHSFDDLLSDGIISLMQAVDKFDYDRGFRFSTYAYRAIARNAYRTITDQHKEEGRFDASVSEDLTSLPEQDRTSPLNEHEWVRMRTMLSNLLPQLDRREQFILRGRFALGAHRQVRTFQCLADKLGISKERVRQLEQRAVAKLQALASQVDLEA
jgi:RNA polymerase primary sigma factor